ncbi:MAG: hypothetical protein R2849_19770 [Thermomicrobiales bacterium]
MTIRVGHTNPERRFLALPKTRMGSWSLALDLAFFAFMMIFFALVAWGERGGDTFFSNLRLTVPILLAGTAALAAGVASLFAILLRGERSVFSFGGVIIGAFVLFWIVAELIGHDEPGPPEGVLTVTELLDNPVYDEEIRVYGTVDDLGELLCPCFTLEHGENSVVVWYDLMVEDGQPARPAVSVEEIGNGDQVIVTGALQQPGSAEAVHNFWAASIELD